jgi:hypothetical protein
LTGFLSKYKLQPWKGNGAGSNNRFRLSAFFSMDDLAEQRRFESNSYLCSAFFFFMALRRNAKP